MTWLDGTLAEFTRPMGLPAPSFAQAPVVKLEFERRGTLYLERLDDAVRTYLARRHGRLGLGGLKRALELCGPAERRFGEFHAGLRGNDELVFLTCVPASEFIAPTLARVVAELDRLHDAVALER